MASAGHVNMEKINKLFWKYVDSSQVHNVEKVLEKYISIININYKPRNNISTPLMRAAFQGSAKLVELLLKNGASIEEEDSIGNTALHWALMREHYEVLKQIISASEGAIENIINKANNSGQTIITMLLVDNDGKYDFDIELLDIIKENDGNFDVVTSKGIPLFHHVCGNQVPTCILEWFIQNFKSEIVSCNISQSLKFPFENINHAVDLTGFNCLQFAILSNRAENVKLMVGSGADTGETSGLDIYRKYESKMIIKNKGIEDCLMDAEVNRVKAMLADAIERIPHIQGFYDEDRIIYIDILQSRTQEVNQKLLELYPDLQKHQELIFVEQISEPEYLAKTWMGVAPIPEDSLKAIDKDKICFDDIAVGYGSITGFLKGTFNTNYALTANHVLSHSISDVSIKTAGVGHYFTENESGLFKISDKYFGVFGTRHNFGVDSALMPLLKTIKQPPMDQNNKLEIFQGDVAALQNKTVIVKGATTQQYNKGQIVKSNYNTLVGGSNGVVLLVEPRGKVSHFIAKGDSGALVTLSGEAGNSAIGIAIKSQQNYKHHTASKAEQVASVVLLNNCLQAISEHHTDIQFDGSNIFEVDSEQL